ncbi:uncharacterized protein G2W53_027277 [Senna tora]|uniref:Uncharacterized protein n=1 Tax=Senna tora TaxID=362788 RepID=A0A834TIF0_9FABA|nr:uncharacterized protein G2W53_027277 [Senna tora]
MSKGVSLLSARDGEQLQTLKMSDCASLHFAWLSSPAFGGSRWLLFFCCYKVVGLCPSAPSSLCSPYAWTPQLRLKELSTKKHWSYLPWIRFWHQLDVQRVGPPWSQLEWQSLAFVLASYEPSLLTSTTKFSIRGGGILCLQQVSTSRNIPSKALLESSRSIEGSWFFFGFFVSAATTSLRACWFLTMLSRRVEEMTRWLLATSSFVLACPS